MRQRCALARTFARDSPILLMDEPFGALDAQTKLALEDLLLQLWQAQRRTVVFITHDLAEAVALSDRVIVMSARPGRIVADVPIALARPRSVRALSTSNTLISCVRPGVLDTRASCLRLASALTSDDLPTLERPTNATSAGDSGS